MRTKISEFSATPGDNTDIDGIDIAEGCAPSGINNAIRELMAQLKDMQTGASGDTFTLTTVNSTTVDTTNLEATNLKAKDGTAAGSIANSTGVVTLASSVLTTTDINGGTIDGAVIGGASAAAVSSTNLAYTGTLTGGTGVVNLGSGQVYKDASGNVGIGTASPGCTLALNGTGATGGQIQFQRSGVLQGNIYGTSSAFRIENTSSTPIVFLQNTGTEYMRITSAGDVGIGTSSPAVRLDVGYVAGSVALRVSRDASNRLDFYQGGGVSYIDSSPASAQLAFATVGSERMRIDSSGNLLVGTTSLYSGAGAKVSVSWDSSGEQGIALKTSSATFAGNAIIFLNNVNVASGFISQSLTTVTYSTSSDYRLKENVAPMTGALAKVAALKPCTYTWKADGSAGQGFIAHELQALVPDAVTGEKDAVDKDGKPQYQGVDTSFLVATLTAAIQEQQALITDLTTRLTALEGN